MTRWIFSLWQKMGSDSTFLDGGGKDTPPLWWVQREELEQAAQIDGSA
jgi:hypothetical protein